MKICLRRATVTFIGLCLWAASAAAQSVPDDTRVIPTAIPESNLVIDVPVAWDVIPPQPGMESGLFSFLDDGERGTELVSFGSFGGGDAAFMLVSRAGGYTRPPLEEIEIIAQGIRMSRVVTWIVGSGMEITVPPTPLPLGDGIEAATMSHLSGPKGDHDVVSMTILSVGDDDILIVDIAELGSPQVAILRAMRRSIRLR